MRLRAIAVLVLLVQSLGTPSFAQNSAALDRFVGTWKADDSKRQMGSEAPLVFRRAATGLEEERGGSANPQYQPVVFDGKPRPTTTPGRTIVWKQLDPNTFERTLSEASKLLTTRDLRIAGKTLTEITTTQLAGGGTRKATLTYERVESAGDGLLGHWTPKTFKSDPAGVIRFERAGNGLKQIGDSGDVESLTLDSKPVPITGGAVIAGTATASKMTDERTIETVTTRAGVRLSHTKLAISSDGKALTETFTSEGPDSTGKPTISVFVKQ